MRAKRNDTQTRADLLTEYRRCAGVCAAIDYSNMRTVRANNRAATRTDELVRAAANAGPRVGRVPILSELAGGEGVSPPINARSLPDTYGRGLCRISRTKEAMADQAYGIAPVVGARTVVHPVGMPGVRAAHGAGLSALPGGKTRVGATARAGFVDGNETEMVGRSQLQSAERGIRRARGVICSPPYCGEVF